MLWKFSVYRLSQHGSRVVLKALLLECRDDLNAVTRNEIITEAQQRLEIERDEK